jgi:hypothetical protein
LRARTPEDLRGQLVELRAWAGQPSLRHLRALGGRTVAASGHEVDRLPPSTISDVLSGRSGPRLPRWEFTAAFVAACLRAARWPKEDSPDYLETWRLAWRAVDSGAVDVAGEVAGDGVAQPVLRPAPTQERPAAPEGARARFRGGQRGRIAAGTALGLCVGIVASILATRPGGQTMLPPGPFAQAAGATAYGGLLPSEGVLWLTDNERDGLSAVLQRRVVGDPEWESKWNKQGLGSTRRWVVGPLVSPTEVRVCLGEGTGPDVVQVATCGPILVLAP